MKTTRLHNNAAPFIDFLKRYRNDRGALANLKGGLSDARKPNAWPLLAGFKGAIGDPAYETVAALWACAPSLECATGCLGDTLARLKTDNNSFEGRFKRLLTCDRDEIAVRVAPIVRAAQAKGMAVNYTQLLSDLLWWGDIVKVEWAKAFWGAPADEEVSA
jgi:CRISPR type I-E-associated protein CasB/Cse2